MPKAVLTSTICVEISAEFVAFGTHAAGFQPFSGIRMVKTPNSMKMKYRIPIVDPGGGDRLVAARLVEQHQLGAERRADHRATAKAHDRKAGG